MLLIVIQSFLWFSGFCIGGSAVSYMHGGRYMLTLVLGVVYFVLFVVAVAMS